MTSQFLLKGHKTPHFLFAFFLKKSETLEAHFSGTEPDINKQYIFGFYQSVILANKKLSKISMHRHFKTAKDCSRKVTNFTLPVHKTALER